MYDLEIATLLHVLSATTNEGECEQIHHVPIARTQATEAFLIPWYPSGFT